MAQSVLLPAQFIGFYTDYNSLKERGVTMLRKGGWDRMLTIELSISASTQTALSRGMMF